MKRICVGLIVGLSLTAWQTPAQAQAVLFGPKEYVREEGKPKEVKDRFFLCSPGTTYTLVVEFGPGETKPDDDKGRHGKEQDAGAAPDGRPNSHKGKGHEAGISSAEIELNGRKVVRAHEFKRKGETIRKTVSLKEDNALEVELHGEPGGVITVWIECEDCIKLTIDEPTAGTIFGQPQAIVRGRVSTQAPETGVAVNGILGQVHGGAYGAAVPLTSGENLLSVRATDACGGYVVQAVSVQGVPGGGAVRLQAMPASGLAPLDATFEAISGFAAADFRWDFEGDGVVDQRGPNLAKTAFAYPFPGLYFPTVALTGPQSQSAAAAAVVNVLSKDQADAMLKGKWEGMRRALTGGDIERAMRLFEEKARALYEPQFKALSPVLAEIAADMSSIILEEISDGAAKYEIISTRDGVDYSHHLIFVMDANGIWKIWRF